MNNRGLPLKEIVSEKLRVAVVFRRFGPYHYARLRAAGQLCEIRGIERASAGDEYLWEQVKGANGFSRVSLEEKVGKGSRKAFQLRRLVFCHLDRIRPQVVAIPGWSVVEALSALEWCQCRKIPALVMSDSIFASESRWPWRETPKRRVVRFCSAGLVAGRPQADYLAQLGMSQDRIFTGYDVVDNDYFYRKAEDARSQKSEVRNRYGLPERYFLASARFIERKNLPRLIRAYARYRTLCEKSVVKSQSSGAPWDLVLMGDGPLRSTLNAQCSTLNLHGHVQMPGFKQYPDLPVYYGLAGAFIIPSLSEPWGLVVNEAMASGLPVLVSNRCGCAQDLVQEGLNGFTFDPYDVEALAQLMFKISDVNFPLSALGLESCRIIADWGPARFAQGLQRASQVAVRSFSSNTSTLDRILLWLLLWRSA